MSGKFWVGLYRSVALTLAQGLVLCCVVLCRCIRFLGCVVLCCVAQNLCRYIFGVVAGGSLQGIPRSDFSNPNNPWHPVMVVVVVDVSGHGL